MMAGMATTPLYQAQSEMGWKYVFDGWIAWQWMSTRRNDGKLVALVNQVGSGHPN